MSLCDAVHAIHRSENGKNRSSSLKCFLPRALSHACLPGSAERWDGLWRTGGVPLLGAGKFGWKFMLRRYGLESHGLQLCCKAQVYWDGSWLVRVPASRDERRASCHADARALKWVRCGLTKRWWLSRRRRHSYNTKSNKTRVIKTPGGK
jgi:hypothetical protein